jgi:signal transduction histidine kinase/CheY-like chemotaxis protein
MVSGTGDMAEGGQATPTVFRSFLEVAGDRISPSTLSKATLTDLSRTLEDLVLVDDAPGTVLTGFQESQHWHTERLRYEALAAGKQRSVAVFSQGQLGQATAVRRFTLDRGHPLAQEWFLFVLTERFSAALFGRELPGQDPSEEMDRLFASVWTFDPAVIDDLLHALQTVAATVSEQAATTVRDAVAAFPPRPADPSVQQRFVNAVFERLEAGRRRWRTTSLELLDARQAIEDQYRRLIDLERLAATGTVAASVAHDLNNPLGTIAMAAATLPSIDEADERARLAGIVEREALRAGRITKDLLTFVSRRDPVRRTVQVPTLLRDLIEGYGLADDRPVILEAADVTIEVDPDRIRQVLANLVDNGLAAPGRAGPVTVSACCERRDLILRVEDDGQGIPAALAARVFTPFVTTKPAGQGTGLGLAIARRHAEDHGGTVTIERTGPQGTVLVVQLPEVVVADDAPTGAAPGQRHDADAVSAGGPGPDEAASGASPNGHVLVVDDEPAIRGLLEALLRRDGWEVTSVETSADAIDAARGASFDVALLDVGDDGQQLLQQLEEHQPGLRSRSAFMTGSPPPDGVLDGRPVLGKPFAWQDLAAMLAGLATSEDAAAAT